MKDHFGLDVWFTIVLSFVAIFLDQCNAVIYERHIIHVPLYVHVVHHHHVRQPKGQKVQKVPNFRPLPAFPNPQNQQQLQLQPMNAQRPNLPQQNNQNLQQGNFNPQHQAQLIQPRLPHHQQQQKGRNPNAEAQWIHPSQLHQFNGPGNFPRGQRPGGSPQTKLKKKPRPPTRGGGFNQFPSSGRSPVGPHAGGYYSTVYARRPGTYRVPSTVRYVARHRTPAADDLSSNWYAYG